VGAAERAEDVPARPPDDRPLEHRCIRAFPNNETLYSAARIGNDMNVDLQLVTDQGAGRQGQVWGDGYAHMPLLAVRFAPTLDDRNAAPAGKRSTTPVSAERNRAAPGSVHTPTVEVSYDDGTTWQATNVKRHHGK
jgi:hypothetical protein